MSRFVVFAGVILCIGPLVPHAAAQDSSARTPPASVVADMSLASAERDMMEVAVSVAPGIHVFHAPLGFGPVPLANEMLIEQRDGLVLVDAGKTRGAGERIVALIRSISPKPVKAVIITHWHQDHVMGLGPIVEAWPHAVIVSSERTRQHILTDDSYRGSPHALSATAARDARRAVALTAYATEYDPHIRDAALSAEERRGWASVVGVLKQRIADERGTYLVVPTVTFTDRYGINDPESPIEARYIGSSHTDGDIVVWAPRQRVVAVGDMVVVPIPYGGTNLLDWPSTLANLKRLRPAVIVPGHGPAQADTRYVDQMIAALLEMRAKVMPLIGGASLTDDQVVAKVDLSEVRRKFAGDDRWLGYWFDQYFAASAADLYKELREGNAKKGGTGG